VRLRIKNAWSYKAPFLISLPYFMIAVGRVPAPTAFVGIAASLCTIAGIAGTAYFLNDLADVAKDRLAGRGNAIAGMSSRQRVLVLALFVALALVPWRILPLTPVTGGLLAVELALFVVYSFPPFRLKERGVLGVITDSLYAHTTPAILAVFTFAAMAVEPYSLLAVFLVGLGVWQFALGLRNIVLHQLQDYPNDLASGTRTLATEWGPERLSFVLRNWLVPLEVIGFLAFAIVVSDSIILFVPAYLSFLVLTMAWTRYVTQRPGPATLREKLYTYADDFYVDWIPLIVLTYLVTRVPECWPLIPIHLLLFRNGLVQWGRELGGHLATASRGWVTRGRL